MNQNLENLADIEIETMDLSGKADGTYRGTYKAFPIEVILDVVILNHEIIEIIIIKHQTGEGEPAEGIIPDIISAQSLDVDVIAGATYSSIVIKLAILDALN